MPSSANLWNRARYSFYAPVYDFAGGFFGRQRRRSVELLNLRPGESLLINGAGTGLDLPFIPPETHILASDIAPVMVERIRARAHRLARSVEISVMDAESLPLPDESFDAAMLHLILAVTGDPVRCIKETARVVKHGGRISIFDKFLPDGGEPSWLRKIGGAFTRILFSDINRQSGPLLAAASLHLRHDEATLPGGLFRIILATKD